MIMSCDTSTIMFILLIRKLSGARFVSKLWLRVIERTGRRLLNSRVYLPGSTLHVATGNVAVMQL